MRRLIPLTLLVSLATLVGVGCGGEGFTQGSGGTGGAGTSGSAGMSAGGGGSGTGGVGIGGISAGGSVSGGSAAGGSDGGHGGAASMTCTTDSDCVNCRYPTAPATKEQCYCANCESTPMTKTACEANDAAYNSVCADVHLPCPAIACLMPATPVCKDQMCVAGK